MPNKHLSHFNALNRVYIFLGWVQIFLLLIAILLRSLNVNFLTLSIENWQFYDFLFEAILWTNGIAVIFIYFFYLLNLRLIKRKKLPITRIRKFIWLYIFIIGAVNGIILFDILVYLAFGDRYYLIIIMFYLVFYLYFKLKKHNFQEIIGESDG